MDNIISIAIYQINADNRRANDYPMFRNFQAAHLFVNDVATPFNSANGVLCYGAIRTFVDKNVYYTNLTMAEIIALVPSFDNGLMTESGTLITTEDDEVITTEEE